MRATAGACFGGVALAVGSGAAVDSGRLMIAVGTLTWGLAGVARVVAQAGTPKIRNIEIEARVRLERLWGKYIPKVYSLSEIPDYINGMFRDRIN